MTRPPDPTNEVMALTEELSAVRAENLYLDHRLARALEMIRIKDALIDKQVSRIVHLEARK